MSQDNTKYFVIAGAVAAASLVGYYFYTTSSSEVKKKEIPKEEKQVPKTSEEQKPSTLEPQKPQVQEEDEKIFTDYENEKLLIKFQHSNTYKVEHIRKEMDEFIHISHRNKNKKDLKIFMEELNSGFEEFINKSCESLQENPIFDLKKTPFKVGKHNDAFKIEYLTKQGDSKSLEGCVMLKLKERAFIFQTSPGFSEKEEILQDVLNSFEELVPTFTNDKFIYKNSKGFKISISDLKFIQNEEMVKEKDVLFSFSSDVEKIELKKTKNRKEGNLKFKGILEKKENQSEIYFQKGNMNYLLTFKYQDEKRQHFILDIFQTLEFDDSIKKDSFIYKNEKYNFNIEFPSYFSYSEFLWSNDFFFIASKTIETTISVMMIPNNVPSTSQSTIEYQESRKKEMIEYTKNNLEDSFHIENSMEDISSGNFECDFVDKSGEFKLHVISTLIPIQDSLCLNIKSYVAVSFRDDDESKVTSNSQVDIELAKSIHKSFKFI